LGRTEEPARQNEMAGRKPGHFRVDWRQGAEATGS
jgi:hypothetical protein